MRLEQSILASLCPEPEVLRAHPQWFYIYILVLTSAKDYYRICA